MEYRGLRLDDFQAEAIAYLDRGRSVIVSAPTGTGKTLIADYIIDQVLQDNGEIIYTAPIKALSNQKYRQYTTLFGRDTVGLVTGDLVINRDAPLRIMTTEILRNILLEGRHGQGHEGPEIRDTIRDVSHDPEVMEANVHLAQDMELPELDKVRAVIVDEIHFLDDPERGTVWEELLIYLPTQIQVVGLSATLSNLDEFAAWLGHVRQAPIEVVYEPRRAVPLSYFLVNNEVGIEPVEKFQKSYRRWQKQNGAQNRNDRSKRSSKHSGGRGSGRRRSGSGRGSGGDKRSTMTTHLDIIDKLQSHAFPALYFIFSRAAVEKLAFQLSRSRVGGQLTDQAFRARVDQKLDAFEEHFPDVLQRKMRTMYRNGIAFHHAGMHVALKALVEELYEAGLVRVLYCTSTFAMGINMPARTVIFDSLTKYNGVAVVPLSVREFMQMAGRAGRRGIDIAGDIIVRQDFEGFDEVQGLLKQLLAGESEPVVSSFNLSFNSIVNLLDRFDEERIRAILESSFKAFQSQVHAEWLREEIARREIFFDDQEQTGPPEAAEARSDYVKKQAHREQKHRRRLAMLKRQLVEEERPRMWEEFQRKIEFLRAYQYVGAHNELQSSAHILQHIKIQEIFMTELLVQGVLEDLQMDELYGVMCGLVQTLPRTARIHRPEEKWDALIGQIFEVYDSDIVQDAANLTGTETIFTPELMPIGERWAQGAALSELMRDVRNPTDLSGDLVGAFRRAKDLIGQMRNVYHHDPYRRKELTRLLRRVTRDEVEVVD